MKEYQMTDEELESFKDIARKEGDPVMYLSGGLAIGRSLQEKINDEWVKLGKKHGFKGMTARPIKGKEEGVFEAEPEDE